MSATSPHGDNREDEIRVTGRRKTGSFGWSGRGAPA
jgi:hypothetical protein